MDDATMFFSMPSRDEDKAVRQQWHKLNITSLETSLQYLNALDSSDVSPSQLEMSAEQAQKVQAFLLAFNANDLFPNVYRLMRERVRISREQNSVEAKKAKQAKREAIQAEIDNLEKKQNQLRDLLNDV